MWLICRRLRSGVLFVSSRFFPVATLFSRLSSNSTEKRREKTTQCHIYQSELFSRKSKYTTFFSVFLCPFQLFLFDFVFFVIFFFSYCVLDLFFYLQRFEFLVTIVPSVVDRIYPRILCSLMQGGVGTMESPFKKFCHLISTLNADGDSIILDRNLKYLANDISDVLEGDENMLW